jgi:nitrogenase molybdenum-iron protein alpha/beta subunit
MNDAVGQRFNPPYLIGAYLAVNAVPDLTLLVDGPTCVIEKARRIHGEHDLFSTLLGCDGAHRIHHSGVDITTIATTYEDQLLRSIRQLATQPDGALLLGSLPLCTLAGTDYDRLLSQAREEAARPLCLLPGLSLAQDWLGGYAGVLEALAAQLPLTPTKAAPDQVAVIGYLMDRNEGEHHGNVAELRRLLRAIGLEPVTIWLSGEPVSALRRVETAGTLISLPHAGGAARILAERLGASLVETELPFGLPATARWLTQVAAATGREEEARALIHQELAEVVPRLEWVAPQVFMNRRFAFLGDPHYAPPLAEQIAELGGRMAGMFLTGEESTLDEQTAADLADLCQIRYEPVVNEVLADWRRLQEEPVDLVIGTSWGLDILRPAEPWIEWGYPSHFTHFYRDEPFLGFQGSLAFLGRMANEISRATARR